MFQLSKMNLRNKVQCSVGSCCFPLSPPHGNWFIPYKIRYTIKARARRLTAINLLGYNKSMLLLIFLLIATNGFGRAFSDSIADQFLDKVVYGPLEKEIKAMHLDPASLPDFGIPFTYELGFIPISGRVDFTNGIFNGLSRVRRLAQCQGPEFDLDDIKIECGLNFFGMDIVYDGKATIEQIIPIPFQVTGYVNESHAHSVISGVPTSLKGNLRLFEITKFGDINIRLSNLGLFQNAYNAVEERFREKVREELVTIIMTMFPIAFRQAITQVRLPGLG